MMEKYCPRHSNHEIGQVDNTIFNYTNEHRRMENVESKATFSTTEVQKYGMNYQMK